MRNDTGLVFTVAAGLFIGLFLQAKQAEVAFVEQAKIVQTRLKRVLDKKTWVLVEPLFKAVHTRDGDQSLNNAMSSLYLRMTPNFVKEAETRYQHDFERFGVQPKKLYDYIGMTQKKSFDEVFDAIVRTTKAKQEAFDRLKRSEHMLEVSKRSLQEQMAAVVRSEFKKAYERQLKEVEDKLNEIPKKKAALEKELDLLRQIKFYLGHPLGKQEYDAYLNDALKSLIITDKAKTVTGKIGDTIKKIKKNNKENNQHEVTLGDDLGQFIMLLAQRNAV